MSARTDRRRAIEAVSSWTQPAPFFSDSDTPGELFAANVFTKAVMRARLPQKVYRSVLATIEESKPLDSTVADVVASAMKDWAMEKGATHYAHVFYPLTGLTAEKHDSFLEPDGDGGVISEFAGKTLVQGEPDASSFPNGGLRGTFEARGYTGWDVTSPAYIVENPNGNTLCIPTVFVSWTGEALDKKLPLLRSRQALDVQARRVLSLFGHTDIDPIQSYAGAEQEYFLIDRNFYLQRPDLVSTGRTLVGAAPPKGQEFDDHYFGSIPDRVLAFMMDVDRELFKLGIPAKTRHNEVAPGQFEIAPVFERSNLAHDHQQLLMQTLRRTAEKYAMECLLHEKPFAGVNGSGKHVNFSFGNNNQGNLLNPGDTPHENAQFLVFCAAVIRGVHRYGGILRAVVASARNDHRLGANEAPPAIISIFLGEQLTDVFEQIKQGGATESKGRHSLTVGVDTLPPLPADPGDRNRTSPFAFTGNRFEFRAPGSSQSISGPMVAINTIVAESLDFVATELERRLADGLELNEAIQQVLAAIMVDHDAVLFHGDGYAEEWQQEAARRGLLNLKTSADALGQLGTPEAIELFGRYGVLNERELSSRLEVYLEQYVLGVEVEARQMVEIANTLLYPAVARFQAELARGLVDLDTLGIAGDRSVLELVAAELVVLRSVTNSLQWALSSCSHDDLQTAAEHCRDTLIPAMEDLRRAADSLESHVADDLWPLPTYQEMLFIL
ncbi:MAG: glutamine synthetase type III [Actinobacteria bacterium]|nr:glutamine synthetase type III [Actinomycetota bacterium]